MSKRKKKNNRGRPSLGIIGFILALLALALFAYFLRDFRGVPFGASLALIWIYVGVATFVLGIIYFAQFIAPIRGDFGWWEGLRLIMRSYIKTSEQFLQFPQGSTKKKSKGSREPSFPEIPLSLVTLRAGKIHSHQVLAITKQNRFLRPAGPGFVNLFKKEKIRQVLDLRTQLTTQPVHFNTRDGIPIETKVTVIFQVKQDPAQHPENTLFPYDKDAIFRLSYLDTINETGQRLGWPTQLTPRAAAILSQELAQYNLDGLINFPDTAVSPVQEVARRMNTILQREFEAKGIQILAASVGPLMLPPDVQEQNIKTWQAVWKSKISVEEAASEAEVIRRLKQARARAQVKIIDTIVQNLEAMRQERESDAYQVIILRLIDALEEAMIADVPGANVSRQIMASLVTDSSAIVRSQLDDPLALPGTSEGTTEEEESS